MLIRLTANAAIHAAAGVATGLLAVAAAEGWRRAMKKGDHAPEAPHTGEAPDPASPTGPGPEPGPVGPEGPTSNA